MRKCRLPRSPLTTRLSGSARETEDRIRSIFQWKKKRPPALVLANFKDKDVDTLLDLMKQAQVNIPLKAVVTPTSKSWVFGDLLAHLQEEHTAFTAAKETAKA